MSMKPLADVESAIAAIDAFDGSIEVHELLIDDVLQDPVGMWMAVITDHAIDKGLEPDGFEQRQGFRIYRYKKLIN